MTTLHFAVLAILVASISGLPAPPQHEVYLHPDIGLNVFELIKKHGYPIERHENIETEDGYLLELHRIPHGRNNSYEPAKPPVLLIHGTASSSVDWIILGLDRSLAYALADLGYDVWLGNTRGNTWSRKHKTLDPDVDKAEYWNFSFHELGVYDLPAFIDYILAETSAEKLFYVGHSQGTASFFVMASEKPQYNDKIRLMSALAPEAYVDHVKTPFVHLISHYEQNIEWLTKFIGLYELMPHSEIYDILGRTVCEENSPIRDICSHIVFLVSGYDSEQLNATYVPLLLSNFPAGAATKQLLHFAQGVKNRGFRKWDFHSEEENFKNYGQAVPPAYDLGKITAPIALYYGQGDWLNNIVDVERTKAELPNVVVDNMIAYKNFNHIDFIWAYDVYNLLYKDVIDAIQKY